MDVRKRSQKYGCKIKNLGKGKPFFFQAIAKRTPVAVGHHDVALRFINVEQGDNVGVVNARRHLSFAQCFGTMIFRAGRAVKDLEGHRLVRVRRFTLKDCGGTASA